MTRLTDLAVRSATTDLWDGELRGFGVRVNKGGSKSFIVLLGSGRRRVIGKVGVIGLQVARNEAKRLLAQKTLGNLTTRRTGANTAISDFLTDCKKRLREKTVINYELSLKKLMLSGDLTRITQREIVRQLNTLTPSNKEHATRVGKTFFTWCRRQGLIDTNPMELLQAPLGKARERVLSDQELGEIYRTALQGTDSYSRLIVFLILTGQRRGESSLIEWSWYNEQEKTLTFPSHVTKNKRAHTIPYIGSPYFGTSGERGYVFPSKSTNTTLNGWSKLKRKFDAKLTNVQPYRLHDLRRTAATNWIKLGYDIGLVEKTLNHISGSHGGVAGIYNRFSYLEPMREMFTSWENHLQNLIKN